MKLFILILTIFAVVNATIDPNYRKRRYISKLPKVSSINSADGKAHHHRNGKFRSNISPLIVGGQEAVPHSRPYEAALYIDATFFCGGTLISNEWVLTAAHCTFGSSLIITQLGAHNRSASEQSQISLESTGSNIITHAKYDPVTLANDIALVRLPSQVTFTSEIAPLALPSVIDSDLGGGETVEVSGWGLTVDDPNGSRSDVLKVAKVSTITNAECIFYYGSVRITETTLCTSTEGDTGICWGDSGSPLTYDSEGNSVHRGLVSFIPDDGCLSGHPDGFIRTTHYLDWIDQQTSGAI